MNYPKFIYHIKWNNSSEYKGLKGIQPRPTWKQIFCPYAQPGQNIFSSESGHGVYKHIILKGLKYKTIYHMKLLLFSG